MVATIPNPSVADEAAVPLRAGAGLLAAFTGAHLVNDFNALMLPAFLPAMTDEFQLSYLQIGILSLSFTILSGLLQVSMGHYADRFGRRRRALVFGFSVTAVGFIGMGLSPTYAVLVLASLLCGLGASTYHPQATALLVSRYASDRGRTMGIHGWGGSVGTFIAPLGVAMLVTALGWRSALFLLTIPCVAVALGMRFGVSESTPNPSARLRGGIPREVWLLAVAFALLSMVIRGFLTYLPTFLVDEGSSLGQAGLRTTFVLIVGLVAQPLGGLMYDRHGGRTVFVTASLAATAGLLMFMVSSGPMLLVAVAVVAFFVFSMYPVSLAMGSELSGAERTGVGVGLVFGLSGLTGAAVQPLVGGIADASSLQVGLSVLIVFSMAAGLLGTRLPAKAGRS